ncbi:hypothetical protein [Azospirillum halopraeferens]|uniref:hypothetical protein n=1 Tax=Azospirillum halopraeferens TaxID=34010 RepID=UPI0003FD6DE4|nr:hypothetical protein [Azospirillum halopraeferens]
MFVHSLASRKAHTIAPGRVTSDGDAGLGHGWFAAVAVFAGAVALAVILLGDRVGAVHGDDPLTLPKATRSMDMAPLRF